MTMLPAWSLLTPAQRAASQQALGEECGRRRHLVVALCGAHAYGFPSPDSDVDLKAVHISPTAELLGLKAPPPSSDRLEHVLGVEIDYTSNELHGVLQGVLAGNGNYLERLIGPDALIEDPDLAGLRPLVRAIIPRRVYRHYLGFATSQRLAFAKDDAPTAKKILYVLRTALTGAHLLRTGELIIDLKQNLDRYGFQGAHDLIAAKLAGERTVLRASDREHWLAEADRAFRELEDAHACSVLQEEPSGAAAIESWLLDIRRRHWGL